jgi:hypothetical protein
MLRINHFLFSFAIFAQANFAQANFAQFLDDRRELDSILIPFNLPDNIEIKSFSIASHKTRLDNGEIANRVKYHIIYELNNVIDFLIFFVYEDGRYRISEKKYLQLKNLANLEPISFNSRKLKTSLRNNKLHFKRIRYSNENSKIIKRKELDVIDNLSQNSFIYGEYRDVSFGNKTFGFEIGLVLFKKNRALRKFEFPIFEEPYEFFFQNEIEQIYESSKDQYALFYRFMSTELIDDSKTCRRIILMNPVTYEIVQNQYEMTYSW